MRAACVLPGTSVWAQALQPQRLLQQWQWHCGLHLQLSSPPPMVPAWGQSPVATKPRVGSAFTLLAPSPEDRALLRVDPQGPGQGSRPRPTAHFLWAPWRPAPLLCVFQFQVVLPGLPSQEGWWRKWQEDVLQLALARQSPADTPGPRTGAPVTMSVSPAGGVRGSCSYKPLRVPFVSALPRQQDPPASCVTTGVDWGKAPTVGAEVRSRPAALPGKSDWV